MTEPEVNSSVVELINAEFAQSDLPPLSRNNIYDYIQFLQKLDIKLSDQLFTLKEDLKMEKEKMAGESESLRNKIKSLQDGDLVKTYIDSLESTETDYQGLCQLLETPEIQGILQIIKEKKELEAQLTAIDNEIQWEERRTSVEDAIKRADLDAAELSFTELEKMQQSMFSENSDKAQILEQLRQELLQAIKLSE